MAGSKQQPKHLRYHIRVLETPGSLLHDPFMLRGGLFGGIAHFFLQLPSMMTIISHV
jgi:hypothetical protein